MTTIPNSSGDTPEEENFPKLATLTSRYRSAARACAVMFIPIAVTKFAFNHSDLGDGSRPQQFISFLILVDLAAFIGLLSIYDHWAKRLHLRREVQRAIGKSSYLPSDAVALTTAKKFEWKIMCQSAMALPLFIGLPFLLSALPGVTSRGVEPAGVFAAVFSLWSILRFLTAAFRFVRYARTAGRASD